MAGPSKNVQGGYLGYSALTESYNRALNQASANKTKRLEQEKLELQNDELVDDMFTLPEAQQSSVAGSRGKSQPKTTVVTNGGFSFTANPNDVSQIDMLTPSLGLNKSPEEMEYDDYRNRVAGQQKDVFKGKGFTLDGSALPSGGTFNSSLQSALEGLKGEFVRESRRTSPRRKREGKNRVKGQLAALQSFAQEIQGAQSSYKQAYDNDLISYGTGSEFIDLLNTLQVPNDLKIDFKDGRGFLVGTSAGNKPINLPLDNLETIKNGLVLKGNNPQPLVDQLIAETNKVTQGVDANGVKTENNAWTVDKTNMVQNQLGSLLRSDNDVLSMGVDWLGYDPVKFKAMVQEAPEEARQNVLDALSYHVRSQHQEIDKGGLTQDQFADNKRAEAAARETRRHNRVTEDQAQQRIDKPSGTGSKTEKGNQDDALFMQGLVEELSFIKPGVGEKDVFLSGLSGGKIKSAAYRAPTKETKDQFPDGYYDIQVTGGGKNLIDVNDKGLLLEYIAGANNIDPELIKVYAQSLGQSNNIKSSGGKKTPAQLAAEFKARQKK